MKLIISLAASFKLAFIFVYTCAANTTEAPAGHGCGEKKTDHISKTVDFLDLKKHGGEALDHAFANLQAEVDTINFDSEAVKNWISSIPVDKLPNLPFIDEGEEIKNIADLVAKLIKKSESVLKENATTALAETKKLLSASFNAAIANLLPKGIFAADAAWLENCCDTTGFWSSPNVIVAGKAAERGSASFSAKVKIGGSLGVEATTVCEISFSVKLSISLTSWTNARFWPPNLDGEDKNRRGCSVVVRAQPNWKATYDTESGGGVMLVVKLGRGSDLVNDPKLKEVETKLSIP